MNLSSKRQMYSMVLVLMDFQKGNTSMYNKWYGFYKKEHENITELINKELSKNIKTPTQQDSWVEWSKLQKLVTSWRRKNRNKPTEKRMLLAVTASLYLSSNYLPPRRNIYRTFKYYSSDKPDPFLETENYYWNGNFYFNDTKSGKQHIKLNQKSMRVIRAIEDYHKLYETEWLLRDPTTKKQLSKTAYLNLLKDMTKGAFPKNHPGIGCRMMRTIFVTEVANKIEDSNLRKLIANRMGHTVDVATQYYHKPYDTESESKQKKMDAMK